MVHRFRWNGSPEDRLEELVDREWLVINGLGGYASATQSPAGLAAGPTQSGLGQQIPGLRLPLFPRAIGARRTSAPVSRGGPERWRGVFSSES